MKDGFRDRTSAPAQARTANDVAEYLRQAIVAGRLAPNERLIEHDVAKDLATNRAVVRGALTQLEAQRLVMREPNRGVRVRSFSSQEAAEILETRALLEGLVVRKAAAHIDAAGDRLLGELVAAMRERERESDLLAYSQLNVRFHRAILEIAAHETAAMLLSGLQLQALRYQFRTVLEPGRAARSLAEHEAIFAALRARDGATAERAMHAHVGAIVDTVRSIGEGDAFVLRAM